MVVLKCIGANNFYLERVVMPTETFLFIAPFDARVELWRLGQGGQICQERSDVREFRLNEEASREDCPTDDEPKVSQLGIRYSVKKATAM